MATTTHGQRLVIGCSFGVAGQGDGRECSKACADAAVEVNYRAMCGRYTSTAAFDELALRFGIIVESGTNEELTARYNVAPSQTVPIITANGKGRRLVMAKWGFRPAWVNESKLAPINARAETVA